jgi:hypothetical protein
MTLDLKPERLERIEIVMDSLAEGSQVDQGDKLASRSPQPIEQWNVQNWWDGQDRVHLGDSVLCEFLGQHY